MAAGGILDAAMLPRWREVADGSPEMAALLEAVAAGDVTDAATLARLRDRWDPALLPVAIELVRARAKTRRKFPDAPDIVGDVAGVEQATGTVVARHKARRFAACLPAATPVFDLCCGIGGDARALARVADVTGIDTSPVRAWMTGHNAGCATRIADVEQLDAAGVVFHLDPARRDASRRLFRYADYRPGPEYIERLLAACPDGAVKLGPGVDLDALPAGPDREIEIIAENGTLVQAVLWCGRLAPGGGRRTATALPEGRSVTATPAPFACTAGDGFADHLLLIDPAVERAGLTGAVCRDLPVREAYPGLGILTADTPVASPWLTTYDVLAQLPWRTRRVAQWLAAHDGGAVTVRTRDRAVDCDALQVQLRGAGSRSHTVFGLRLGRRVVAVITRAAR